MSTDTRTPATAVAAEPAATNRGPSWGALAVVMTGTFITVLDYFISNVAVPSIQEDLGATAAQGQMVIVGYGVAFTAGMITGGKIGDLYGRRRMFMLGLALFTLASAGCGLAPSAEALIALRIAQGASAALMVPQVLGIIGSVYTGPSRAKAFTVYGLVVGQAAVFGQVIGGVLITADVAGLDWRSIFLINVPIGAVALACAARTVPESRGAEGARLDLLGALLTTAALVLVVYALVQGREDGWPAWSWAALGSGAVLFALAVAHFARRGRQGRSPLIDLSLFRVRSFSVGLSATLAYFLAMGSFFYLLALYLQQGRGLSPLQSGLLFFALGAGFFGSSVLLSPKLGARLGQQLPTVGTLTLAVGYGLVGLTVAVSGLSASVLWLVPSLVVAGAGMGMTTGPLTNVVLSGVDPEHAASASGALNTAQEGGAAIGVSVAGTVFFPVLGAAARPADYPHAFDVALIPLAVFCVTAAALMQLLRRRAAA
ncbi:MFS transporter [Streptomyces mashuensis]|uniref:MFS transporter n=1 Tax=Streptomyces mashuensis TaxID=33904 RepID=A0A919EAF2_9ACTN|nr:MFS transporter [Streptomyces mashuensis]GHF30105.1 MFS transporter [Streptomyces mashuensis]